MNKVAKILSSVISVTVALSLALVMLTSALAAATTTFAVNVVSETDDKIVISVDLVDGGFQSIDFEVKYNAAKISGCSAAEAVTSAFTLFVNNATCKASGMYLDSKDFEKLFDTKGAIATFTFDKIDGADIGPDDITVEFEVCGTTAEQFDVVIKNNIPEIEVPTTEESTTEESTTEESTTEESTTEESTTEESTTEESTTEESTTEESTTEESTTEESTTEESTTEESTTEESTTEESTTEESTTEATEPSTEAPAEDKTEAPAEDKTDAPVADEDVANPDTGDSVTASAAVISLLAASGAAIVALRKKED